MSDETRYEQAAGRAVQWLSAQQQADGSFGAEIDDLACYYKSPYLFALSGRARDAAGLLAFVVRRFLRPDGDLATSAQTKSANVAFEEFTAYPNGWLALGAQRLGRFDVAYPTFAYLQAFDEPHQGGFRTNLGAGSADALTTAHLGLLCLQFGASERATRAGAWLARLLEIQPDLDDALLLRADATGRIVEDFPPEAAAFHAVSRHASDQAYFMIGYPIAFLAKLAEATGQAAHLDAARGYLDFAWGCEGNLRSSLFSHKIAWGASVLGRLTGDARCDELSTAIVEHLLEIQDPSGAWLPDEPPHTGYDQTAEIAIWLQEIAAERSRWASSSAGAGR
jgi:hypothetical protein